MANKVEITVTEKGTAKTYSKRVKGADKATKSLVKSGLKLGAAYIGAKGVISVFKSAITKFGEQEDAEKALEVALGRTSQKLLDQASALQQVTVFGDENIIKAQALIGSFVKEEDQIAAATKATLDLAAAKGMDLVAAADLVSKTLGSSTNAMSRYGIEVKGTVGSTERLTSLTENIARVFGGQATAQAETMAGAMAQAKNAIGDLAEVLGSILAPVIIMVSKGLKQIAEFLGRVLESFKALEVETTAIDKVRKSLAAYNIELDIFAAAMALGTKFTEEQWARIDELNELIKNARQEINLYGLSVSEVARALEAGGVAAGEFTERIITNSIRTIAQMDAEREAYFEMIRDKVDGAKQYSDAVISIGQNLLGMRKAQIQSELEAEIAAVLASTKSEEEKNDTIATLREEARQDEIDAAKAFKWVKYAQAISNTAVAVTKSLPNIPLALLVAAAGAAELATIAAQPFAHGGFTGTGLSLAGEQGPELERRPVGTQIFNNAQTKQIMGGPQTFNLIVDGETIASAIAPSLERGSTLGDNNIALT